MIKTLTAVAAASAILLAGCTSSTDQSSDASDADYPELQLANADSARWDFMTYAAALDEWASRCTEDRVTAAGIVDATYKLERKDGVPERSRLVVMRHLTASVPMSAAPTKCTDIAAAYVVLREN